MGGGLVIVLGIETSTPRTSVALGGEEGTIASESLERGRGHVEFLMPAIGRLCERAGARLDGLGGIAVGLGPGLFTGMRVGIATAKTLAQVLAVPVVGLSSLDVLAFGVGATDRLVCACADAKRGEVFDALYRRVPGGVDRIGDHRARTADAVAAELSARGEAVLFVGTGASAYHDRLSAVEGAEFAPDERGFPLAEHLVELALPRILRGESEPPSRLEPLYVRRSDAEIRWGERGVVIERPLRVKVPKRARAGEGR